MSIDEVVVNASPLIAFFRSNQADLFRDVFGSVVVPNQVIEEIEAGPADDPARVGVSQAAWIDIRNVTVDNTIAAWNLGKGESGVFSFALRNSACLAVVDDFAARRCAKAFGIPTIGAGGVLVIAKQKGVIEAVVPRVQRLRDSGLYLSDAVANTIAAAARETLPC